MAAVMNGIVSVIIPVLDRLLAGHETGAVVVGGALDLPPGLPAMARCDYYCGCVREPILMLPVMFSARLAHSAALAAGGIRWIRYGIEAPEARSRWE